MTTAHSATLRALTVNTDRDWAAAWALTHAAASSAARSTDTLPLVEAVPLLLASADLRAAEDYLEQARRDLPARGAAMDVDSRDTEHDAPSACGAVEQLVRSAMVPVRRLWWFSPTGDGAGELARVDALLCSARRWLLGSQL